MSRDQDLGNFLRTRHWLSQAECESYARLKADPDAAFMALALENGVLTLEALLELEREVGEGTQSTRERVIESGAISAERAAELDADSAAKLHSLESYIRWQRLIAEPLLDEALAEWRDQRCKETLRNNKYCVLVVDDSPTARRMLREALEAQGCEVQVAESGLEAIERASEILPHLITMDVDMPGLNGFDACAELRKASETTDIPVVMVTSHDGPENRARGFEVGAVEFVTKHTAPDAIASTLLNILHQLDRPKHHRLLIIDDSLFVRHVLDYGLRKSGFNTQLARTATEGLQAIEEHVPDLVLLDLRLPDVDGRRLLRLLKAHPTYRSIPIVVMSAIKERETILQCLTNGAADYLFKPFDIDELAARVSTHVRLGDTVEALHRQSAHLEHLNNTKDQFYAHLAHDLRSPFNAISGPAAMLLADEQEGLSEEHRGLIKLIAQSSSGALQLIDSALENFRAQYGDTGLRLQLTNFYALLHQTIVKASSAEDSQPKRITINGEVCEGHPTTWRLGETHELTVDPHKIARVLTNIVGNAFKYADSTVDITVEPTSTGVRCVIQDDGPGIPECELPHVWDAFRQGPCAKPGSGLGLSIVRAYINMHGGSVRVESDEGAGATFTISIPDQATATSAAF